MRTLTIILLGFLPGVTSAVDWTPGGLPAAAVDWSPGSAWAVTPVSTPQPVAYSWSTRSPTGHTHTCGHGHTWDHTANPTHTCKFCGMSQYVIDQPSRPVTVLVPVPTPAVTSPAPVAPIPAPVPVQPVTRPSAPFYTLPYGAVDNCGSSG